MYICCCIRMLAPPLPVPYFSWCRLDFNWCRFPCNRGGLVAPVTSPVALSVLGSNLVSGMLFFACGTGLKALLLRFVWEGRLLSCCVHCLSGTWHMWLPRESFDSSRTHQSSPGQKQQSATDGKTSRLSITATGSTYIALTRDGLRVLVHTDTY